MNGNGTSSSAATTTTALAGLDGIEDLDLVGGVEKEEGNLINELQFVKPYLEFAVMNGTINSNLMTPPNPSFSYPYRTYRHVTSRTRRLNFVIPDKTF